MIHLIKRLFSAPGVGRELELHPEICDKRIFMLTAFCYRHSLEQPVSGLDVLSITHVFLAR